MPPEQIGDLLFNGQTMDYLDYLPDPHDVDSAIRGYGEASTFARLAWNPRYDTKLDRRLPNLAMPALVIEPDDDRLVPNAHAKRWAGLLPDARLRKVKGREKPTGHLLMIQEPDATAAVITRFIRGGRAMRSSSSTRSTSCPTRTSRRARRSSRAGSCCRTATTTRRSATSSTSTTSR